jgi:hypothetical protein
MISDDKILYSPPEILLFSCHVYEMILLLWMEVTVFWNVMFTKVSEEPAAVMFRLC